MKKIHIPEDDVFYAELEARAAKVGVKLSALCGQLGISRATPWRWKNGKHPILPPQYRKLLEAINNYKK